MDKTIGITLLTSSGIIGTFTGVVLAKLKKASDDNKALRLGVQALLRDRLYALYHEYAQERKYAPIWVKENFENLYAQYHSLGENGVMDGIHEEFKLLPTAPVDGGDTEK